MHDVEAVGEPRGPFLHGRGNTLRENGIELDRNHTVDDVEQGEGERTQAGPDLEHDILRADPGDVDDAAHRVRVVHEVLAELLRRAHPELLRECTDLGGSEQRGEAARRSRGGPRSGFGIVC